MKMHCCFFLGITKYNICNISFGEFVQTVYHREGTVFYVGLDEFGKMSRGVFHVSPEPGYWR